MSNRFRVDEFTAEEWQKFGATFSCNNIYQSWAYGEAHSIAPFNNSSRAILFDRDRPVVMAQFHVSRIPVIGIGVIRAHWGPLWRYDEDSSSAENHLGEFLSEVRAEYGVKRGLKVRFDPHSTFSKEQDARLVQVFKQAGYFNDLHVRAYRTIIIDLSLDLDMLYANLDRKWRKHLKRAEKAGLEVEYGSSVELFDRFRKVYDEMWAKKKFVTGVNYDAIRRTQSMANEGDRILIWIVREHGKDIGAHGFSAMRNTMLSFLAATSPKASRHSNSGYLLHWLGIRKAKELGLRWHDLGGVTDIPDNTIDRFKKRMNGTYTMFPGRFEAHSSAKRALFFDIGEKCFKKIRQA